MPSETLSLREEAHVSMATEGTHWWQKYGTVGQLAQAVVTSLGVIAALFQIDMIHDANKEASARQIYLGFLDKQFSYPRFAVPDYERIKQSSADEQILYESFVAYMLYSCEEALEAFSHEPNWRLTCESGVKVHLPFLCEHLASDPDYLNTFAANTANFVRAMMAREGLSVPECKVAGSSSPLR